MGLASSSGNGVPSSLLGDLSIYWLTGDEWPTLVVFSRSYFAHQFMAIVLFHRVLPVPIPGLQAPGLRLAPRVARMGMVRASVTKGLWGGAAET